MGFCLIIPFGIAFSLAFHVKHLRVIRNQRIAIDVEEPLLPHKSMAITKQGMRWDARPDLAIGNLNCGRTSRAASDLGHADDVTVRPVQTV